MFATDQPFGGKNRVLRIGNRLPFRDLPNEELFVGERNDARRRTAPFGISNDLHIIAIQNSDARVGRAEVYSDNPSTLGHRLHSDRPQRQGL